jgi:hypothetical protein
MKIRKYKSQKSNDLNSKFKSYSALTSAFLLSAGSAQSQIIYTDIDPDTAIVKSLYDIDLDHDGVADFVIQHWTSYGNDHGAELNHGMNLSNGAMAINTQFNAFLPGDYLLNLPAGNPIGPGGPFYSFVQHFNLRFCRQWRQFSYPSIGAPPNITTYKGGFFLDSAGYVGVQFHTYGNTYYGWIECAIDSGLDAVVVKGYAYESTPNLYIVAGAGKPVGIQEQQSDISPAASFYPNPVVDGKTFITIDSKQPADLTIAIINGMGQVLQRENRTLNSGKNIIELNVNAIADGSYFVKLTEGDKIYFRKILVVK